MIISDPKADVGSSNNIGNGDPMARARAIATRVVTAGELSRERKF